MASQCIMIRLEFLATMLAAALKERVRSKQLTYGPMLTFAFWPGYLEIFKSEGMHYAVLDMEHGAVTLART